MKKPALLIALVVLTATACASPSPATPPPAPIVTSRTATLVCTGADPASQALLEVLGGNSLSILHTLALEAPASLRPGQADVEFSHLWTLALQQTLSDRFVGLGITSLRLSNAQLDLAVSGATSTTNVLHRPDEQVVSLVAGQPAAATFGPVTSPLDGVGGTGSVFIGFGPTSLTLALSFEGTVSNVDLSCGPAQTVAEIPITATPGISAPG